MPRTIPIKVLQWANPPTRNVAHFVHIGGIIRSEDPINNNIIIIIQYVTDKEYNLENITYAVPGKLLSLLRHPREFCL